MLIFSYLFVPWLLQVALFTSLKEVGCPNRPVGLREQKEGNGCKLEVETPVFGERTPPTKEDVKTVMRIPTCLIVVN